MSGKRASGEETLVTTAAGETTVRSGRGRLQAVIITTDLTNDVNVLLEDGTSPMMNLKCPGTDDCRPFMFPVDIPFTTRLDVTVTGTGGVACVITSKD